MYGCDSWTLKKAECRRIDAFELWCWRRLLRVLWTTRKSNQSNPKVLNSHRKDWSWSWNSNTLATWCEKLTHWKRPWCWERLNAKGEEDGRGWNGQIASLTQWTWVRANSERWWRTGKPGVLQCMEWKIAGQQLNKNNKNAACMGFPGSSAVENLPSKQETWQEPWVWSLCSPRDSQVSSLTPQFKNINSSVLRLLYSPALTSIHDYWKNHSFGYTDLC